MALTDKELVAVIAFADALDPYGITTEQDAPQLASAWRTSIPFWVDADMAREAVRAHYLESSKRISIADIVRRCKAIKDARFEEQERLTSETSEQGKAYVPTPDWFKRKWGHMFPANYGSKQSI